MRKLLAQVRFSFASKVKGTGSTYSVIVNGAAGVFIVKVSTMMLSLLVAVCLARALGATEYGVFAYIFTVASTIAMAGRLGTDVLNVREVSVCLEDRKYDHIRGLLIFGLNITLFLSAGLMLLFLIYLGLDNRESHFGSVTWFAVLLAPLVGILKWQESVMRAMKHVIKAQIPDAILRPLIFLLCIGVGYLFFVDSFSANIALLMCVASLFIALIYGFLQLLKHLPQEVQKSRSSIFEVTSWLRSSVLLCGVGLSAALSTQLPSLVLGMYVQGDDLGIYFVCVRIANLMTFVFLVFNVVLGPYAARMYRDGDMQMMASVSGKVVTASLLVTLPVVIFGYLKAGLLLELFGVGFAAGEVYLRWLILANYFAVAAGSGYLWLVVSKNEKVGFYVSLVTVFSGLVLCYLLIPSFGVYGAVLSAACNILMFNFLNAIFVKRIVGFDPTVFGIFTNRNTFEK